MKKESNKNWTTCLRLNTGDGSPRVFLLNSHFLGSVPILFRVFFIWISLRAIISTYNAEALILPAVDSTARSSITTIGSSMDFKKGTCSGFVYAL